MNSIRNKRQQQSQQTQISKQGIKRKEMIQKEVQKYNLQQSKFLASIQYPQSMGGQNLWHEQLCKEILNELDEQIIAADDRIGRLKQNIYKTSQQYYQQMIKQQNKAYSQALTKQQQLSKLLEQVQNINYRYEQAEQLYKEYETQANISSQNIKKLQEEYQEKRIKKQSHESLMKTRQIEIQEEKVLNKGNRMKFQYLEHKLRNIDVLLMKEDEQLEKLMQLQLSATMRQGKIQQSGKYRQNKSILFSKDKNEGSRQNQNRNNSMKKISAKPSINSTALSLFASKQKVPKAISQTRIKSRQSPCEHNLLAINQFNI